MAGFVIWVAVGVFFIGIGISSFTAKRAVGFWANVEMPKVNDVQKYNHAMGRLWIVFGIVLIILGIPLLDGQNSPLIFVSILGAIFEVISVMIIYSLIITPRYIRNHK